MKKLSSIFIFLFCFHISLFANEKIAILETSPSLTQGGSAIVVYKMDDFKIKKHYIEDNEGRIFYPQRYLKKGYFVTSVAYSYKNKEKFSLDLVTKTRKKTTKTPISIKIIKRKFPESSFNLPDSYIDRIAKETNQDVSNYKQAATALNTTIKKSTSEILIAQVKKNTKSLKKIKDVNFTLSYPLLGSVVTSTFAKLRSYYYKGKLVKQSTHQGLDLASVAHDDYFSAFTGKVIWADYHGGYGNAIIISHDLNIFSLYGHSSKLCVKKGDKVQNGDKIGETGMTGSAQGDHLHFSVFVQKYYVEPTEWLDENFLKHNILEVLSKAKEKIEKK